jgi:drug/metabolite transporter (DMT)-like permease
MADLALVLIMAIWGGSFSILRVFLRSDQDPAAAVSPLMFLALRMAVASALLAGFMLGKSATAPKRAPLDRSKLRALLRDGILCGVLLGGGFLLQTEGIQRTTASRSGFFTGLLVVFVPVLEFFLFKKKPALPALVALALAFCGMALLAGRFDSGGAGSTTLGDLLTVACALVFAGHILALGRAAPRHPILGLLLCQLICVGLMAGLLGPLVETTHLPLTPPLWIGIAYLSILATLLAFGVQTWAQRKVSPVRIALLSSLEPVFAAGFAALLIGERLSSREWAGGGLIVFGVLVGEVGAAWLATRKARAPQT